MLLMIIRVFLMNVPGGIKLSFMNREIRIDRETSHMKDYQELKENYNSLKKDYDKLIDEYNLMIKEDTEFKETIKAITIKCGLLKEELNSSENMNIQLKAKNAKLKEELRPKPFNENETCSDF